MADRGSAFVLDSFALLAYLGAEPGMPKVRAALEAGIVIVDWLQRR